MGKFSFVICCSILANWRNMTSYYGTKNHCSCDKKTHKRPLIFVNLGIAVSIVFLTLFSWVPQMLAHGTYEWMIPYKTKTGASCCGVDDCGKILSFDANNKHITIQNQSGRVWKVRYRFASATLHYSPDSNKYACGTYSSYVPNYARCIWLPQEAKANQQQDFAINHLLQADRF